MRKLKGTIVSTKTQKTAVVRIDRLKKHPKYQRYYRASTKLKAHDATGQYNVGDVVVVQETRPMSKDKRWRVVGLVKRTIAEESEGDEMQNEK